VDTTPASSDSYPNAPTLPPLVTGLAFVCCNAASYRTIRHYFNGMKSLPLVFGSETDGGSKLAVNIHIIES
jgi:hypothetical protein